MLIATNFTPYPPLYTSPESQSSTLFNLIHLSEEILPENYLLLNRLKMACFLIEWPVVLPDFFVLFISIFPYFRNYISVIQVRESQVIENEHELNSGNGIIEAVKQTKGRLHRYDKPFIQISVYTTDKIHQMFLQCNKFHLPFRCLLGISSVLRSVYPCRALFQFSCSARQL